jgi:ketosteroid isomerase-like protein
MRIRCSFRGAVIIGASTLGASAGVPLLAHDTGAGQRDRAAIDRLHQQDVDATLSDRADQLATLWDTEAIRIGPGRPPEIGKAAIYANDKRWEQSKDRGKTLCYRSEMKDLQIAGDWAFEWGYFSFKDSADPKPGRGKVLRVMRRQANGSWKFARVVVVPDDAESAAPMSHPCE